jgi:YVTN family beta-propeller protein
MRAMRRYLLVLSLLLVPAVALAAGTAPRVVAKIRVGTQPCAGLAAFGSYWQTTYGASTLSRVNPQTNKVTKTGRLGIEPCGIAAGAGSLWIDGYGTGRVERVNRKTLKVVKRIKVGVNVWDVAFAFGSAWATNNIDGSVSRINPATNRVIKTIKTGGAPSNFAVAKDAVWVGSNAPDTKDVYRIDPSTNTSTAVPTGHLSPSGIVVNGDSIWASTADSNAIRIDATSRNVVATVKIGTQPGQGDAAPDGTIWFPNLQDNTISVIDPQTNSVTQTVKTGNGPFVVRSGFGDMWVASYRGKDIWRIRP